MRRSVYSRDARPARGWAALLSRDRREPGPSRIRVDRPTRQPRNVTVHELSRTDARRIAVRAQLLDSSRPAELLDVVRHLTLLQIDPVAAIAPSAELVAWSRLGSAFPRAGLRAELENRTLLELQAMIGPSEDLALYRADMAAWESAERANPPFSGRAALLSPFDRLIHDRKRAVELFEFDYQLEMYKPAAKRRWGYFALPILYGDRLVGKLDATADRTAGVLKVHAIHKDTPFTKAMTESVAHEIKDLARWLGLELALPA